MIKDHPFILIYIFPQKPLFLYPIVDQSYHFMDMITVLQSPPAFFFQDALARREIPKESFSWNVSETPEMS